jgi:iron complex outermembrane receptor protein
VVRFCKAALLGGVAFAAVSAGQAFAADGQASQPNPTTDANAGASVTEVVVTARRQSELAKDVPIAVSAYSADKLDKMGATQITDLEKTTPNTTVQVSRGTNSTLTAYIRGIGQQDPLWGFEPGVGLYIDDVYVARPQLAVLDIYDVNDIEVLRGPQGTLYGRNTIGGAIKYTTARIGPKPEFDLKGMFGSYGEHDEIVGLKGPLTDKVAAAFTFAKYDHDGYGKNLNTGADAYNKDVMAMRATVEFKPTNDLFFRISADQTEDDSNARHGHRLTQFPAPPAPAIFTPTSNVYDTMAGAGDANKVVTRGVSGLAEWDVNQNWTLKSITAYRDGHTDGNIDFDETPLPMLDIPAHYSDHQFTEEVQALYKSDRLHGVLGAFYMNANAAGAFDTVLGLAGLTILTDGSVKTNSWAIYGNGAYDITDKLTLELGGRWTQDDKTGNVFREYYLGIRSPYFGNSSAIPLMNRTNYTNERTFSKFTPRASLTYKITPALTTYVAYGNGFKSGGFDMRGDAVLYPNTVKGYDPETVDSYEIGLKGSAFAHRLNFSTALFDAEYKNIQVTTQYPVPAGIASVVDNVGRGRIRGWEGEGSFRIAPELSVNVDAGYLDTAYTQWKGFVPNGFPGCTTPTGCVTDLSKQKNFAMTPRWNGAASLNWTHDLGDHGRITFLPVASYRSSYQIFETRTPLLDQQGYWLYDVNLTWTSPDRRYEIGLHGKNLSDERYKVGGYTFPGNLYGNSVSAFYGDPRTFLATLSAKF